MDAVLKGVMKIRHLCDTYSGHFPLSCFHYAKQCFRNLCCPQYINRSCL